MMMLMRTVLAACLGICTAFSSAAHAGGERSLREAAAGAVVPAVRGLPVEEAYDRLHRAGLRVSFARNLDLPSQAVAEVVSQTPRPGRRARRGSVVSVRLSVPPTGAGSPAVPNELKTFTVPDFHRQPASAAVQWAEGAQLRWQVTLPALSGGKARHLLDNYVIVHQEPAAGARLSLGREEPGGGFTPTPLKLRVDER